jgi:hypothetical protein
MKNIDDAIDWANTENPTLDEFIRIRLHKANPNIGLPDKDQELLDKPKLPYFMDKEKSKSPTLSPNQSESSTNYKILAVEIPLVNIKTRDKKSGFTHSEAEGKNGSNNICKRALSFF